MKASLERDDAAPSRIHEASELERRLVRFRSTVAEEDTRHERGFDERLREQSLRGMVEEIRDVEDAAGFLTQRLHDSRMLVAERVDCDAAEQIPAGVPVSGDDFRALTAGGMERSSSVRAEDEGTVAELDGGGRVVMQQQGGFLLLRQRVRLRGGSDLQ